jgi:hypothetical protein
MGTAGSKHVTLIYEDAPAEHEHGDAELRALEHERYEGYIAQLRPLALAGDLGAHRALLRWHERLAKLLNLDLRPEEIGGPQVFLVDTRKPWEREESVEGEWEPVGLPAPSEIPE